eukprot:1614755-Prymnesium_polylepis.1
MPGSNERLTIDGHKYRERGHVDGHRARWDSNSPLGKAAEGMYAPLGIAAELWGCGLHIRQKCSASLIATEAEQSEALLAHLVGVAQVT